MHILDKPIVEGIINIKKLLRQVKDINIFRLNSKEAQYPNQFIIDYQNEISYINKEFENYRSKIKEIIKEMCEEEVHNFMVIKKMLDSRAVQEDNKLLMRIETQTNKDSKNDKDKDKEKDIKDNNKDTNKDANIKDNSKEVSKINNKENNKSISKDNNTSKNAKDNKNNDKEKEKSNSKGSGSDNNEENENENSDDEKKEKEKEEDLIEKKYNYKLNKQREILKNINIPDDLYKSHITKEEKFKKQLNNFIKNETIYAQIATKRNFYCIILIDII